MLACPFCHLATVRTSDSSLCARLICARYQCLYVCVHVCVCVCVCVCAVERGKDGMSDKTTYISVSLQSRHLRQRLLQPVQRQEVLLCARILSTRTSLQRSLAYRFMLFHTVPGACACDGTGQYRTVPYRTVPHRVYRLRRERTFS